MSEATTGDRGRLSHRDRLHAICFGSGPPCGSVPKVTQTCFPGDSLFAPPIALSGATPRQIRMAGNGEARNTVNGRGQGGVRTCSWCMHGGTRPCVAGWLTQVVIMVKSSPAEDPLFYGPPFHPKVRLVQHPSHLDSLRLSGAIIARGILNRVLQEDEHSLT
eukprot:scaffold1373_cov367-Pinguiococcus_pyrenoidosus.AAC.28